MRKLVLAIAMLCALSGVASAQVAPYPFIKPQFFDNSGHPLAGGRLWTYAAGTTTPLSTFTDSSGLTPNPDPIILDSAGRPPFGTSIWIGASSYKFVLQNSMGVQIWSVDNVTNQNISLLGSNNIWTGTNTWNSTSTFNSSVSFNSGFTSTGPNTLNGGGALNGTYTGNPTFSGVPNFTGGFAATTGSFSGQITSTLATGTAPFVIASTTKVANLNVDQLDGCDWAVPCPLGSTTPNTASITTLLATSFTLAGGMPQIATQGTDNHLMTAGTVSGGAGTQVCLDAQSGLTTTGCGIGASKVQAASMCPSGCTTTATPCTTGSSSFDTCPNTIIWPTPFVDANYSATCSGVNPVDGSNPTTGRVNLQISSKSSVAVNVFTVTLGASAVRWTEIDCNGVHP
jgi:hypothetical protein